MSTHLFELFNILSMYIIWIVLGISLVINAGRIFLLEAQWRNKADVILEFAFNLQFYALIPLLPLALPTLCLIARSYGNAQIVCLFDVLQSSTDEFKDEEDIDEFDAAPPPTKAVSTEWSRSQNKPL
ncbi:hypothetical protein HDU96_010463 [Phlyctochytrium bullatum]|nr:hypothetical protein HDU96_010463 [Phlyctochytrium bullatum]